MMTIKTASELYELFFTQKSGDQATMTQLRSQTPEKKLN